MLNTQSLSLRHPVLTALIFFILISVFSLVPAIFTGIMEISETQTMYVYAVCFALSALIAVLIMRNSSYLLSDYGLTLKADYSFGRFLGFLPLLLVTGVIFVAGIDTTLSVDLFVATFLYILAASINEELYFRGLILRVLQAKGTGFAVIISSLLFGFAHLGSLTTGKGLNHTLLLIFFSALFAIVSGLLVVTTGSLIVPIVWHFVHNLVSSISVETTPEITLLLVVYQCVILLGYAVYLWKKLSISKHNGLLS